MLRATLYQFRGEPHEPVKISLPKTGDNGFAAVRLRQHGLELTIDTNDPAWLEELEGAVRAAREHLESRTRLEVAS